MSGQKNQKILLAGVVISLFGILVSSVFNYLNYSKLSQKQIQIIRQVEEIKGEIGNFNKIYTSQIYSNNSTMPTIFRNGSITIIGDIEVMDYNNSCSGFKKRGSNAGLFLSCRP